MNSLRFQLVHETLPWPLPKEPYCEFCRLQDLDDLATLTDNLSFLDEEKATEDKEKAVRNLLDDSSDSSDNPEDFLADSWILNPYGTNEID